MAAVGVQRNGGIWSLVFALTVFTVAGLVAVICARTLRAGSANPQDRAVLAARNEKLGITVGVLLALAGVTNLWFFLAPGGGVYSLVIGIAALAVSAVLLASSVRRLRRMGALQTPPSNDSAL